MGMLHEIAPNLVVAIADALGLDIPARKQQAGIFDGASGQHERPGRDPGRFAVQIAYFEVGQARSVPGRLQVRDAGVGQDLNVAGGQQIDLSMLPDDMFREKAERRAALGVIVSEIVKVEELTPDEDSVRERINEIASTYEQPKEVVDYYYSQQQLLSSVEAVVLEDQVTELVLSKATVADEACSYEDAVKPDPEPGA